MRKRTSVMVGGAVVGLLVAGWAMPVGAQIIKNAVPVVEVVTTVDPHLTDILNRPVQGYVQLRIEKLSTGYLWTRFQYIDTTWRGYTTTAARIYASDVPGYKVKVLVNCQYSSTYDVGEIYLRPKGTNGATDPGAVLFRIRNTQTKVVPFSRQSALAPNSILQIH